MTRETWGSLKRATELAGKNSKQLVEEESVNQRVEAGNQGEGKGRREEIRREAYRPHNWSRDLSRFRDSWDITSTQKKNEGLLGDRVQKIQIKTSWGQKGHKLCA